MKSNSFFPLDSTWLQFFGVASDKGHRKEKVDGFSKAAGLGATLAPFFDAISAQFIDMNYFLMKGKTYAGHDITRYLEGGQFG